MKPKKALGRQIRGYSATPHGVLAITIVIVLLITSRAMTAQDDNVHGGADVPPVLKVGSHAPDFTLPGVDGKTHSLSRTTTDAACRS
jgi:hypothetical protein